MSGKSIPAGEAWVPRILPELAKANFGIVCVTPENLGSPWLHFEAGGLAMSLNPSSPNRVCPLLYELTPAQLSEPLKVFQAKMLDKKGLKETIEAMCLVLPDPERNLAAVVTSAFHKQWPTLERILKRIPDLKEDSARLDLDAVASNFAEAVAKHESGSPQFAFVHSHIRTLARNLRHNSERLRQEEVVTDYDDCSLLSEFVRKLRNGDELIGLTDWELDGDWWRSEDARTFRSANQTAINNGAKIRRIFVHANGRPEEEIQNHKNMGIEVLALNAKHLPRNFPKILSQCVISCGTPTGLLRWLTYRVELDHRGQPLRNVFSFSPFRIEENYEMLNKILDCIDRHCSEPN